MRFVGDIHHMKTGVLQRDVRVIIRYLHMAIQGRRGRFTPQDRIRRIGHIHNRQRAPRVTADHIGIAPFHLDGKGVSDMERAHLDGMSGIRYVEHLEGNGSHIGIVAGHLDVAGIQRQGRYSGLHRLKGIADVDDAESLVRGGHVGMDALDVNIPRLAWERQRGGDRATLGMLNRPRPGALRLYPQAGATLRRALPHPARIGVHRPLQNAKRHAGRKARIAVDRERGEGRR